MPDLLCRDETPVARGHDADERRPIVFYRIAGFAPQHGPIRHAADITGMADLVV